jgi:hypothetical protein
MISVQKKTRALKNYVGQVGNPETFPRNIDAGNNSSRLSQSDKPFPDTEYNGVIAIGTFQNEWLNS